MSTPRDARNPGKSGLASTKVYVHAMTDMSISMPPALKSWVDAQIAQGRYADAGDYLRDLVRRDQEGAADDVVWVRAMIEEGLASGIVDAEPEDVLKEIMARLPND